MLGCNDLLPGAQLQASKVGGWSIPSLSSVQWWNWNQNRSERWRHEPCPVTHPVQYKRFTVVIMPRLCLVSCMLVGWKSSSRSTMYSFFCVTSPSSVLLQVFSSVVIDAWAFEIKITVFWFGTNAMAWYDISNWYQQRRRASPIFFSEVLWPICPNVR